MFAKPPAKDASFRDGLKSFQQTTLTLRMETQTMEYISRKRKPETPQGALRNYGPSTNASFSEIRKGAHSGKLSKMKIALTASQHVRVPTET